MDICLINKRIDELDYLKSIMIVLMIAFHLVYIGDGFPYAKRFVYTFHMPVFLLLTGYLMNIDKGMRKFMRQISFYAVPYVVMESGYSVFVPAGTTMIVLPSTLSGSFEIRFETDTYYYYGYIDL